MSDNSISAMTKYKSVLQIKSTSTQKMFQTTINNIEKFGKIDMERILEYNEDEICRFIQDWVIWNRDRGITTSSIMCYLNSFRLYVRCCRRDIDWYDVQQNITFPRRLYEDKVAMTPVMIKEILNASEREFRFQLLALVSSGLRVGELGHITSENMDFTHSNIMVKIPSKITKTGRSRITFFSKQVSGMIRYRIKSGTERFTFCEGRTSLQFTNLILKRFSASRKRAGLMKKHDHCKQNRYTVHINSMRSYFITKANKVQFGVGHILAGHKFYMCEYNQYTDDEMLCMYKKFEKDLTF